MFSYWNDHSLSAVFTFSFIKIKLLQTKLCIQNIFTMFSVSDAVQNIFKNEKNKWTDHSILSEIVTLKFKLIILPTNL